MDFENIIPGLSPQLVRLFGSTGISRLTRFVRSFACHAGLTASSNVGTFDAFTSSVVGAGISSVIFQFSPTPTSRSVPHVGTLYLPCYNFFIALNILLTNKLFRVFPIRKYVMKTKTAIFHPAIKNDTINVIIKSINPTQVIIGLHSPFPLSPNTNMKSKKVSKNRKIQ